MGWKYTTPEGERVNEEERPEDNEQLLKETMEQESREANEILKKLDSQKEKDRKKAA